MNIESIGIRNGVAQGQAQGAKSAGDPLAALFAEFLGLADALVAGGTAKAKQADEPSAEQQQLMVMAGLPILPAAAQGTTPAQQQGTTHANAAAVAAAGGKAVSAAAAAAMPGAALPIQVPKEGAGAPADGKAAPAADGKSAAAADGKAVPDGKPEPKPGDAATPAATAAALPPLAVSLAPNVTLAAPKTAAPAGAEKAKPAASSGSAAKSTAPVSVTVEKAPAQPAGEARRAEEPVAVAAAARAPSKDEPATPAKPELTATAPAPTSPPPQMAQGPVDKAAPPLPQAAAVPLHDATQQVVHRVEKAVEHGEDRIRIELKPASLGGVEVHLHIADDGRVNAVVRADRADTLSLLQSDARGLEQALKDAGLRPDAGSLSFNLRQGEGQAGHQPDARGQRRRGNSERAVFAIEAVGAEPPSVRDLPGGLDIRI